jgi:hypothetical protein
MAWSQAQKDAASARATARWAAKKAASNGALKIERGTFDPQTNAENFVKQSLENLERIQNPPLSKSEITINVDWENLSIEEAQSAYATLQAEIQKAGKILNARTTRQPDKKCWYCKKPIPDGKEAFKDDGYHDPKNKGMIIPIRCCSEPCYIHYHEFRIKERRDKFIEQQQEQSQSIV